jgi:putative transposase
MNEGKKFRVYPTKEQIKTLSQWIGHQRFIYNSKVGEDRYFRKFKNKSLSLIGEDVPCDQKYSQFISADTDFLKDVPSQILRNGVYRWMSAYQRFFKKLSGRPTIKKKHGRQSVMITKELFTFYSVDPKTAMINLGTKKHTIGPIRVNVHLEYEVPATIYISVHGGKWYVSFSNENELAVATEAELLADLQHLTEEQLMDVASGFARNVIAPVASSNGSTFDSAAGQKRSLQKALMGKVKCQKLLFKKQKGSSSRRKAVKKVGRYDRKISDIRNDFAHKTSKSIVDAFESLLVFEDLGIKNMTASAKGTVEEPGKNVRQKAGLNRSILNAVWGRIKTYTRYKGLRKNKLTIEAPAHHSSQECSRCSYTHTDNRPSQAEFICQDCGFACNADLNASLVIKKRGVRTVLNNEVHIKIPKKIAFSKKSAIGPERSDRMLRHLSLRRECQPYQPKSRYAVLRWNRNPPLQLLRRFSGGRVHS